MINYINLKPIIYEWIEDNPINQDYIDESQLYRWALDPMQDYMPVDTGVHRFAVIDIKNTKGLLPPDVFKILSVAYRIRAVEDKSNCTTVKRVTEYIQPIYGNGCDIEIRTKCNKCQGKCSCERGIVEVNVDRHFQLENPWYYEGVPGISKPGSSYDFNKFSIETGFRYMAAAHEHMFNAQNYVGDCVELGFKGVPKYRVETLPVIEVNLPPTRDYSIELLVAYLGKRLDENGDFMVPNIPDAKDAIKYHLSYMYYRKLYLETEKAIHKQESTESMLLRDLSIGRARTQLSMPEYDQLKAQLSYTLGNYSIGTPVDTFFDKKTIY